MLKFVDLFAGTGGIRLGFEQACLEMGIQTACVMSSEIDPYARMSYELNFRETPQLDIRKITDIPDFDFLLAGFPCQSFSYAGKRKGFGDTRGTLFFEVERILKQKKPKFLLLENVRGLATHDNGKTLQTIENHLNKLGYSISYRLLNSSNFNVPQNRVRIYILGVLNNNVKLTLDSDCGASDTHKFKTTQKYYSKSLFDPAPTATLVKDILESEVSPQYYCSEDFISKLKRVVGNNFDKLHGYRLIDYRGGKSLHSWELGIKGKCSRHEIEFMNLLISNRRKKIFGIYQDGKSLTRTQIETFYTRDDFEEVTSSLLQKGYLKCRNNKYNPVCGNMSFEVFKFLDPEGISITLTASDANRLGVIQKNTPRRITPRECARLQGFPDSYLLIDHDTAVYKQMGNAVSVPVIKAIATDFIRNNINKELFILTS